MSGSPLPILLCLHAIYFRVIVTHAINLSAMILTLLYILLGGCHRMPVLESQGYSYQLWGPDQNATTPNTLIARSSCSLAANPQVSAPTDRAPIPQLKAIG